MGPTTIVSIADEVMEIFMRRDGMTRKDAEERFKEAYLSVEDAIGRGDSIEDVEDLWMDEIGLEPDYLYGIFYFG